MSKGTVNKVILIGRLGKDPDMRYTSSGTAVTNFTMATNHSVREADGNYSDRTEWHRVVAYGRTAEVAGEYLNKGKLAYVEGRIQSRSWEDKNGQKRYTTEIICSNLQLLGSRTEAESRPDEELPEPESTPEDENTASQERENTRSGQDAEDDLPF